MFSSAIVSDSISTISTLLYLLKSDVNSTIYLNRIGSNPVEHCIGSFRMLSKNQNTYHKLKKVVGEKNLLDDISKTIKVNQRISGRIPSLGEDLSIINESDNFVLEPKVLAYSLFSHFGFNIDSNIIKNLNITPQKDYISNDITYDFFEKLEKIISVENEKCPKKTLLSTTQFDSVQTVKIQDRLSGKGNFF